MIKDISQISTYESGVAQSSAHRITMKIKNDFLSQYGLTAMQWFVIGFVYEAGSSGLRLNELKKYVDSTMPFITNLVNNLEAKGILHKISDLNDSRIKIALLNPSYRKTVEEIESGLRQKIRDELYSQDGITRDELKAYMSVIYKITQLNK